MSANIPDELWISDDSGSMEWFYERREGFVRFSRDVPQEVYVGRPSTVTANDKTSWLREIYDIIHGYEDERPDYDMNDAKTAMAWIAEELGVDLEDI